MYVVEKELINKKGTPEMLSFSALSMAGDI
jgi:hypothetical protein